MKAAGIIAEYNPFHKGHAYQIEECRRQTGCDYVIVLMSGNYVQRGEPAVFDAYSRAEMALRGGADLILSLPIWTATASAEGFCEGAVRLLDALHLPEAISFGVEVPAGETATKTLQLLCELAQLLAAEPAAYRTALREGLKQGLSFPAARSKAVSSLLPHCTALLDTPNNILAAEYLKAIEKTGAALTPFCVERIGSGYHDRTMSDICSATALRAHFAKTGTLPTEGIPTAALPVYNRLLSQMRPGCFLAADDFSDLLFYRLEGLSAQELSCFADISLSLARRILKCREESFCISELCAAVGHRQLTQTGLMRGLLHVLLSMKKDALCAYKELPHPPYTQVLGCKKSALSLLSHLRKFADVPILVRASDCALLRGHAATLYETERQANTLYRRMLYRKTGCRIPEELRRKFEPLS